MALVLKDRVYETSTTSGTGTLTLAGAIDNFQTFSSAIGNGNTTYYTIADDSAKQWEVGIGTVGAGTLSRNTVYASSNGGSLVNFSANAKQVFCDYPASKSVYTDASGNISNLAGSISKPTFIEFDQTYSTALSAGQLGWDGNNTLALGMAGGNVVQHIGEDSFFYIKASSAITKGQLVMFTGAVGASGVLTGAPSTGVTVPEYIMGVAAEDIANNGFGLVQCFGELTGVNTNGFNEGDVLYYDSAVTGGLTNVYPTTGPIVTVAAVAKKSAGGGVIYIRVSVTQRITAGTGATVTQTSTGTSIAVTNPYNPASVAITGGTINGTTIGATTPAAGTFTTITGQTEVLKGTGENFLTYSQTFQNAAWIKQTNVTATDNTTVAPDGTTTAATISWGSASNATGLYNQKISLTWTGLSNTKSIYVRADIAGGTVELVDPGNTSGSSILTLSTSWQRVTLTEAAQTAIAGVWLRKTASSPSTVYVWGGQLEIGTSANAYVPTTSSVVYGTPSLSFSGVAGLGLQSDGALYVSPAGTGAIQAQATTSSATGGNARGANAVDWQTSRGSAGQVASASQSVVGGGASNTASGSYSTVAGGNSNTSSGQGDFIGGGNGNSVASNFSTVVGGQANSGSGFWNFIGGGYTNSGTSSSAATTQGTTTVTSGSTAVTLSGSNASIKVGQMVRGTGIQDYSYVAAISGTSLTLSQNANATGTPTLSFFTPHGVVVGGGNNQATGSYSFIGGGGDAGTAANRNVASGDYSVVVGGIGNQATNIGAFVGGGGRFTSGIGGNTASGLSSAVVSGLSNQATGGYSFVGGGQAQVCSGTGAFIGGGYYGNTRTINGNHVFPASLSPLASASGTSQSALLVLARQTTDATATVLTSDSSAAGTTNQVILPNNSAYFVRGTVIAGVTGGGNTSAWDFKGAIKRGANAASTALVGVGISSNLVAQDAGAATWAVSITADTTNGGLKVTVTGQAATTIRWVCEIETTEMTY